MKRAPLEILLLPVVLMLGCSAEPPPPGAQPAQSATAAGEPEPTPIFTDDFEEGKAESWAEGEAAAQPAGDGAAEPAETD